MSVTFREILLQIPTIVAFLALVVAYYQLKASKTESRLAVAKGIYKDYLALAFANPKFSSPSYPITNPVIEKFEDNSEEYERYEFFVSYMLFGAEEILELTKNSSEWRATLRSQLKYHAIYLNRLNLPEGHYISDLLTLRDEAIAEYKEEENDLRVNGTSVEKSQFWKQPQLESSN